MNMYVYAYIYIYMCVCIYSCVYANVFLAGHIYIPTKNNTLGDVYIPTKHG